jgi:FKBP-type peptidyl-prolyl cis-trans isomerase FkpA
MWIRKVGYVQILRFLTRVRRLAVFHHPKECFMKPAIRLLLAALSVCALGLACVATPADDKKDEKKKDEKDTTFEFPDLEAKEWKKLDNGMKVWDVKEGKGDAAKAGSTVEVNYVGWTTAGKKFDSSIDRKETISFGLNRVIKGWTDGVPGMKPGGVRRLVIPPELAYGERGAGKDIKPNATLVFVIEYIGVGK